MSKRSAPSIACGWPAHASVRSAFTLFEVVLAIALGAVLVGLLAAALHAYLFTVNNGRGDVEQSQLARAVLARISKDLRAAIRVTEQDVSSIASLAQSSASFDVGSLDEQGNSGGSGSSEGSGGTSSELDIAANVIPPPVVGLYGNQYELQVDISRIPRFDELDALLQVDVVPSGYASDVRTIAYYLQQGTVVDDSSMAATGIGELDSQTLRAGLIRRELDRATALYSSEFGGSQLLKQQGTLLAPEVTWIEFQYFDGTQLWTEWNSTDRGGLPMAVQVSIWFRPPSTDDEFAESTTATMPTGGGPSPTDRMYQLVVHLPAAEPTSTSDSTSAGSSTGGSSAGTGSQTGGN